MTETELRNKVVNVMQGWLGWSEKNGKFKAIIDFYNTVFVAANNDYLVSIKRNILRETLAVAFTRVSKPRPQSSPRRLLPLLPPRASPCRRASSRRQNRPSTACGRASTPPARPPSGWSCHLM